MLISFTCSNFRSFRDEQTLWMLPGKTRNHPGHLVNGGDVKVLCTSAMYGANASGKSNIFSAMKMSRNFILGKKTDKRSYFRLDDKYKTEPTTFEYEFSTNGRMYRYGFQIILSTGEIKGEWLWRLTDSKDDLIFQRPLNLNPCPAVLSKFKVRTSKFLLLTLTDELRRRKDPDSKELIEVRDWFEHKLKIIGTGDNLLPELSYDEDECRELSELINSFDVGVSSVDFRPISDVDLKTDEQDFYRDKDLSVYPNFIIKTVRHKQLVLTNNHGSDSEIFYWYDESDGTRRIMDLASIIVSKTEDVTYVVDEIERSLHPLVAKELIGIFTSRRSNRSAKQLIFTTHQTSLLDQDLLRRDEIWFVDKGEDGVSRIKSLEDFNVRFDKNIEKLYLDGRYGGIPRLYGGEE